MNTMKQDGGGKDGVPKRERERMRGGTKQVETRKESGGKLGGRSGRRGRGIDGVGPKGDEVDEEKRKIGSCGGGRKSHAAKE